MFDVGDFLFLEGVGQGCDFEEQWDYCCVDGEDEICFEQLIGVCWCGCVEFLMIVCDVVYDQGYVCDEFFGEVVVGEVVF